MTTTPALDAPRDVCARLDYAGIAGVPLWIVSIEDLILSKLEWMRESGSEQQRRDVRLLLEATLDQAYLTPWAIRLRLDALLDEVRRG